MRQVIGFTKENFDKLSNGKTSTIRFGIKPYSLWTSEFKCVETGRLKPVAIVQLRIVKFKELNNEDAIKDGLNNIDELKEELERIYDVEIKPDSIFTVVDFI